MGQEIENTTIKGNNQAEIKKILIAIDKSGYKEKIIRYGLTLAKALGADVTAVHVIDRYSLGVAGDVLGYYRGGKVEAYQEALKKQALELLSEAEALAKKEGIKVTIEVITDSSSAAEGIIDYAKRANMDLIVIGTKGMTGIEKFVMGGVANKVTSHAHCSVLAVR